MQFIKKLIIYLTVFIGRHVSKKDKCVLLSSHIPIQNLGDQALVIGSLNGLSRFKEVTLIRTGSDSCKEMIKKIDLLQSNIVVEDELYLAFATNRAFIERLKLYLLIARHKACYAIGADVLDGVYNEDEIELLFEHINYISMMNVKVTIVGSSFSRNISRKSIDGLKKLHECVKVNARDIYSLERIKPYCKTELTADAAFLMEPAGSYKSYQSGEIKHSNENGNKLTLGICIKDNDFSSASDENDFINLMIELSKKYSLTLVSLPHHQKDYLKVNSIFDKLLEERVALVKPVSLPAASEIKRKCKECDLVITGRMHVAIASLSQIVPVICYSYGDKFAGLLEHFNLPAEKMIVSKSRTINCIVDYCISQREELEQVISNKLNEVIILSENNFN